MKKRKTMAEQQQDQPDDKPARMAPSEYIKELSPQFRPDETSGGGCIIGGVNPAQAQQAKARLSDTPAEALDSETDSSQGEQL
jgi:hypothetical protein